MLKKITSWALWSQIWDTLLLASCGKLWKLSSGGICRQKFIITWLLPHNLLQCFLQKLHYLHCNYDMAGPLKFAKFSITTCYMTSPFILSLVNSSETLQRNLLWSTRKMILHFSRRSPLLSCYGLVQRKSEFYLVCLQRTSFRKQS